jgi:Predicted metal-dependent hydrolase
MRASTQHQIELGGRRLDYRVVHVKAARKLRLRVGPHGLEVVKPAGRNGQEVSAFLGRHESWILAQLQRVERLRSVRTATRRPPDEILFRGKPTKVRVETTETRLRGNVVEHVDGIIVVQRGPASRTLPSRSLENWLRKQARAELELQLAAVATQLGQRPERIYVKGQRTKWGSCSARRNLSFNWRLILAPDFVLRYLVAHEVVHLAVPDHSARFWLTVQSLCRETEPAKQWLRANTQKLTTDLVEVFAG